MPDERARCTRCGQPLEPTDTFCPWCAVRPGQARPPDAGTPEAPVLVRTVTCSNCQATSPADTVYCPACGRELNHPGFSATSVWPPGPQGQINPQPVVVPLLTSSVALDIAAGVGTMILGIILIPITFGITLIGLLIVYSKCYNKYPIYRRGMHYGFIAVCFLLMTPCLFCLAGASFRGLWQYLPFPFPKF